MTHRIFVAMAMILGNFFLGSCGSKSAEPPSPEVVDSLVDEAGFNPADEVVGPVHLRSEPSPREQLLCRLGRLYQDDGGCLTEGMNRERFTLVQCDAKKKLKAEYEGLGKSQSFKGPFWDWLSFTKVFEARLGAGDESLFDLFYYEYDRKRLKGNFSIFYSKEDYDLGDEICFLHLAFLSDYLHNLEDSYPKSFEEAIASFVTWSSDNSEQKAHLLADPPVPYTGRLNLSEEEVSLRQDLLCELGQKIKRGDDGECFTEGVNRDRLIYTQCWREEWLMYGLHRMRRDTRRSSLFDTSKGAGELSLLDTPALSLYRRSTADVFILEFGWTAFQGITIESSEFEKSGQVCEVSQLVFDSRQAREKFFIATGVQDPRLRWSFSLNRLAWDRYKAARRYRRAQRKRGSRSK